MSFSVKVKNEVCRNIDISKNEAIAQLSAIMKVSGTMLIGGNKQFSFKVTTENPAIARVIFKILKQHFNIHTKIMVKRSNSLKKNNVYMVMITEEMGVRDVLKEVGLLKENRQCIFLRLQHP